MLINRSKQAILWYSGRILYFLKIIILLKMNFEKKKKTANKFIYEFWVSWNVLEIICKKMEEKPHPSISKQLLAPCGIMAMLNH